MAADAPGRHSWPGQLEHLRRITTRIAAMPPKFAEAGRFSGPVPRIGFSRVELLQLEYSGHIIPYEMTSLETQRSIGGQAAAVLARAVLRAADLLGVSQKH